MNKINFPPPQKKKEFEPEYLYIELIPPQISEDEGININNEEEKKENIIIIEIL